MDVALVSWLARRTSIGPNDLLEAPPEVFDRMVADELEEEEQRNQARERGRLQGRLKAAGRSSRR